MSSASVRKRARSPITETLDDVDWGKDLVLAGEDGFEIRELGHKRNRLLKLEYNTGDGWRPLRPIFDQQVAYFPPGTFIRKIGCTMEPTPEFLAQAEEFRGV